VKQIKISALKLLKARDIIAALPFELISDGEVIGEVKAIIPEDPQVAGFDPKPMMEPLKPKPEQFTGTCTGCGRQVTMGRPDNKPFFFSQKKT
jgi:hypothetical protein